MRHLIKWLMHGLVLALFASSVYAQPAALHLVFVIDGLRPDSITEADTPTLYRLRREGVAFDRSGRTSLRRYQWQPRRAL